MTTAVRLAEKPPTRRFPVRRVLCVLPLLLVAVVAVRHRSVLAEGFGQLATARWPWLLAAAGATCLTWVAAACTRQGAVVERLPRRRLLATQFAAGAANHLLPTGLGASAVNLRFMTVCGLPLARSSAALALYLLAESVGRVALLGEVCRRRLGKGGAGEQPSRHIGGGDGHERIAGCHDRFEVGGGSRVAHPERRLLADAAEIGRHPAAAINGLVMGSSRRRWNLNQVCGCRWRGLRDR